MGWLRRMFGRADRGWDAVNERAWAHLANVSKLRESRALKGDPVIEREYQHAEEIVRQTSERAESARP